MHKKPLEHINKTIYLMFKNPSRWGLAKHPLLTPEAFADYLNSIDPATAKWNIQFVLDFINGEKIISQLSADYGFTCTNGSRLVRKGLFKFNKFLHGRDTLNQEDLTCR